MYTLYVYSNTIHKYYYVCITNFQPVYTIYTTRIYIVLILSDKIKYGILYGADVFFLSCYILSGVLIVKPVHIDDGIIWQNL